MILRLSRAGAAAAKGAMRPRACFELGQRVTEVGAALAYADFFARRLGGADARDIRDLSAGIHTAALAAKRLAEAAGAGAKSKGLEKDLGSFNDDLRKKWAVGPVRAPTPAEAVELQRRTSELRKKAMEIWADARLMCPDGAAARPRVAPEAPPRKGRRKSP